MNLNTRPEHLKIGTEYYCYDPERDIWVNQRSLQESTDYAWISVIVLLSAVAWAVEHWGITL